jgi:hypothetical protein
VFIQEVPFAVEESRESDSWFSLEKDRDFTHNDKLGVYNH